MLWCSVASAWGAARRILSRPFGVFAALALAACAGGCSLASTSAPLSMASTAASGATIAFESIDGPPPEVFNKLVTSLNAEAGARHIAVVSRSAPATYRVRGYVSAMVERDKTSFAWVWDIYDTDKRRALRISGEEPAGAGRRRDAWTAADEPVLRRMAGNGMEQIAGFLRSPAPSLAAAPEPSLVTLVSRRDDSPEGAGILREPAPAPTAPPQGPRSAKTRSAAIAATTDGRSPRP